MATIQSLDVDAQRSAIRGESVESDGHDKVSRAPSARSLWVVFVAALASYLVDRGAEPLVQGLRFDENLTGWVTSGSFRESITRSWNHQGQSPLYFALLWVWQQVAGSSEIAMRIPSVVAIGFAIWHLNHFARDLERPLAGPLAATFLVLMDHGAVEARPYAVLLLATVVSARYGMKWAVTGSRSAGLVWVVAGASAIYFQPLAVYALIPHVVVVVTAVKDGRLRETLALIGLGGALILPVIPQVMMLQARQETLVFADPPGVVQLLTAVVPVFVVVGVAAAQLVDRRADLIERFTNGSRWHWFLLAAMSAPPVGLFVQSYLTGNSVFVSRYLATAAPALALVVGLVLATSSTRAILLGTTIAMVLTFLTFGHFVGPDWKAAVVDINASSAAHVWTTTGYIESVFAESFVEGRDNDYLNAPLLWHGVNRKDLLSIPAAATPTLIPTHEANIERAVAANESVLLVESNFAGESNMGVRYVVDGLVARGYAIEEIDSERHGVRTTLLSPRE